MADGRRPVGCVVSIPDPALSPLADHFLLIRLRNNTDLPIEVRTNAAFGLWAKIDTETNNSIGSRITTPFYDALIGSPSDPTVPRAPAAVLRPGEITPLLTSPFRGVDEKQLAPGRYRCRVRFKYLGIDVASDFREMVLTRAQIDAQPLIDQRRFEAQLREIDRP